MTTQNEMIRHYLESGHRITALEALQEFGCFRLAARINDLKAEGLPVKSTRRTVQTRQAGIAHIAEYYL